MARPPLVPDPDASLVSGRTRVDLWFRGRRARALVWLGSGFPVAVEVPRTAKSSLRALAARAVAAAQRKAG